MNKSHICLLSAKSILNLVNRFKSTRHHRGFDYTTMQSDMNRLLNQFDEALYRADWKTDDVKLAKYALAALVDEIIMLSNWQDKLSWMSKTLQWQHFGEHNAGEGFFHRLTQLREAGRDKHELLEWYYLCLAFGFQGMYRLHFPEKLSELMREVTQQVNRYYVPQSSTEPNEIIVSTKRRWDRKKIIGLVSAVLISVYFILFILLHVKSFSINQQIETYHESIHAFVTHQEPHHDVH